MVRVNFTAPAILILSLLLFQNLERAANQQRTEMAYLRELLVKLKLQAGAKMDALERATHTQKQRAERSENAVGQLRGQLLDMVMLLYKAGVLLYISVIFFHMISC